MLVRLIDRRNFEWELQIVHFKLCADHIGVLSGDHGGTKGHALHDKERVAWHVWKSFLWCDRRILGKIWAKIERCAKRTNIKEHAIQIEEFKMRRKSLESVVDQKGEDEGHSTRRLLWLQRSSIQKSVIYHRRPRHREKEQQRCR